MLENRPGITTLLEWHPLSGWASSPSSSEPGLLLGLSLVVCTYCRSASLNRFLDSLRKQELIPEQLLIIDASPDNLTKDIILDLKTIERLCKNQLVYCQVTDPLRGLTRQRNLALELATNTSVAFFDDDILLEANCLKHLNNALTSDDSFVGMSAFILHQNTKPGIHWKLMRMFKAVPDLYPGRYHRSGISVPLRLLEKPDGIFITDRLPGGCTLWRTNLARQVRFSDDFTGYGRGEDIDFSLRIARFGKLGVCGSAHVQHIHEPSGRPNPASLARMTFQNRYAIYRKTFPKCSWTDIGWFFYSQTLDSTISVFSYFYYSRWRDGIHFLIGSVQGMLDVLFRRKLQKV